MALYLPLVTARSIDPAISSVVGWLVLSNWMTYDPPMTANAAIEMRWVEAWNEVYAIAQQQRDIPCQLPDWTIVTLDDCLAWLQDSVYAGYRVRVEAGWVGHRRGIKVSRAETPAGPA